MSEERTHNDKRDDKRVKRRALRIAGIALGSLAAIILLCVTAATLYLTPGNLTRIVNERASKYLNADIRFRNLRFTLWSTFPRFCLEFDSVAVVSRNLAGVSPAIRRSLPANADTLASAGAFRGSVNMLHLPAGRIDMDDVVLDKLRINLAAYNDSINNYDIFPATKRQYFDIPYISARLVRLTDTQPLTYFSASAQTYVKAHIRQMSLTRHGKGNRYMLIINGKADARIKDERIAEGFPFSMTGDVDLRFHPFGAEMNNYALNLGNTRGHLDMDILLGRKMSVNKLEYKLEAFNPMGMADYFPAIKNAVPGRLRTDITLLATARITSPYKFPSSTPPDVDIDFSVPGGRLDYTIEQGNRYTLDDMALDGTLHLNSGNPEKSSLDINNLRLRGEETDMSVNAHIADIMAAPHVEARIKGKFPLKEATRIQGVDKDYKLSGTLLADAELGFRMSGFKDTRLSDIKLQGNARMENFAASMRKEGINVKGGNLSLDFKSGAGSAAYDRLTDVFATADGTLANIDIRTDNGRVTASAVTFNLSGPHKKEIKQTRPIHNLPMDLSFSAEKLSYESEADTIKAGLSGLRGKAAVREGTNGKAKVSGDLHLERCSARTPSFSGVLRNANLNLRIMPAGDNIATGGTPDYEDAPLLAHIGHTPADLKLDIPDKAKQFLRDYDFELRLKSRGASVMSSYYPAASSIQGIDLRITPDALAIAPARVRAMTSGMQISGRISGLRKLLLSGEATPMSLDLDVALDTVNINELAHIYEQGLIKRTGSNASMTAPKPTGVSATDTLAMLLPRNIKANIHATAAETRYVNLHLRNLSTDVSLNGGDLSVDSLRIYSDFGHAFMNMKYTTSDIERIGMNVDMGLEKIDIVTFFERFHKLLLMMPQMKNLSGNVSLNVRGGVNIYPTMYLNIPSASAEVKLRGRDLILRQSKFIRRVTRMMLIHDSDPIHIVNINARASVHDNLLEVYPFNLEFDRYKLFVTGLNNFNGQLYYHVGIRKSPVPFPFGINVIGEYRNPELRFGGVKFKVAKGEEVISHIQTSDSINIPKEMKYYMREFVHKAAQSYLTGETL